MSDHADLEQLLDVPIPVLSNRLLLKLMEARKIVIEPFHPDRLGPTAYRICPHRVRFLVEDEVGKTHVDRIIMVQADGGRSLRPGEYAVVSPEEKIAVAEGFVADFFPSSSCVENKLVLTAGRLDAGYKKDLVFGVFNAGRSDAFLTSVFQLARVSFAWLGRANMPTYDEEPGSYISGLDELRSRPGGQ